MISYETSQMLPLPWVITRIQKETRDTFTLELSSESGEPFDFQAGQFNMLYVYGVGEVPISISGESHESTRLLHTVRNVGAVTAAMSRLRKGDQIGLRGPYGKPWPLDQGVGQDIIIVAGGIGLAPLRPAIRQIIDERSKYGNIALLYGARTPEEILYRRELEKISAKLDIQIYVTVDQATANWRGHVGVVTSIIPRTLFNEDNAIALVCGPEIMIRYATQEFHRRGLSNDRIFVSMERNMKCGIGHCGHCQFGPHFVCHDGPVFPYSQIDQLLQVREV